MDDDDDTCLLTSDPIRFRFRTEVRYTTLYALSVPFLSAITMEADELDNASRTTASRKRTRGSPTTGEIVRDLLAQQTLNSSGVAPTTIRISEAERTKNRILDISLLFPGLESFLCCQKCHRPVKLTESDTYGLGFKINVGCPTCRQRVASINSSKPIDPASGGYEVNRSSVLAARTIGQEHSGLSAFCDIMDLPKPIERRDFDCINEQLNELCQAVLMKSGATVAAKEEQEEVGESRREAAGGSVEVSVVVKEEKVEEETEDGVDCVPGNGIVKEEVDLG